MNCREAVQQAFDGETGVLTTADVVARITANHPAQPWKTSTISHHLVGFSVNHPSSRYHLSTRQYAFLFSLGNGRYRLWDAQKDGRWVVTETGVELVDEDVDDAGDDEDEEVNLDYGTAVSLERDLEANLVANLTQLETGLRLYQGDDVQGRQFDTGVVGRIDILAVDKDNRYVVIELKAGEADEKVFGQILRYMGWVRKELANGAPVRGIIVANSFHEKAKYAAEAVQSIALKKYEIRFRFAEA